MTILLLCVLLAAFAWWGLLFWPARAWRYEQSLAVRGEEEGTVLDDLTVVIPARNESALVRRTLRALGRQGRGLRVVLVDDQSKDGTVEEAQASGLENLTVVHGKELPPGWVGKLWALEQGIRTVKTDWILLLDADIELAPGVLAALHDKATREGWDAVSIMATPRLGTRAERFFLPAFVYFFKLLYPFSWVTNPRRSAAAAAGGCILLKRAALESIGGFASLRSALIDDCSLARRLKNHGYRIWLGTSHEVVSLRAQDARSVALMVMRTAYTQLRRSPTLLVLTTLLMTDLFVVPWVGLFLGGAWVRFVSLGTLLAMTTSYLPTLHYYRQPIGYALFLTPISLFYLLWTWKSAARDFRGVRSEWKGRRYRNERGGECADVPDEDAVGMYNHETPQQTDER